MSLHMAKLCPHASLSKGCEIAALAQRKGNALEAQVAFGAIKK